MIFHKKLFYNLFNVTKFKDTLYKLLITITVNDIISLDESMCTILHLADVTINLDKGHIFEAEVL